MPEPREAERASWPPLNILLVDDSPAKLLTYDAALAELGQRLLKAHSVEEALAILLRTDVALIVTDVHMPGGSGYDLARMVREHPRFARIPIMFVSAEEHAAVDDLRAYASGAVDYVTMPVTAELLRAKVKIFIDLFAKERELARLKHELEARVEQRTKRLSESEERYRSLVDNANDVVATLDLGLQFTSFRNNLHPQPLSRCQVETPHPIWRKRGALCIAYVAPRSLSQQRCAAIFRRAVLTGPVLPS